MQSIHFLLFINPISVQTFQQTILYQLLLIINYSIHIRKSQIMNLNQIEDFITVLKDPNCKLDSFIANLLLPQNQEELKKMGKTIFGGCKQILAKNCQKYLIQRIAKFLMMSIVVGHLHILQLFNRYFLRQILDVTSGIAKFSPLCQFDSNDISPIKLRNQLISELICLLSRWFPHDFVNHSEQSKYVKIVEKKKINLKAYFILNSAFIKSVQQELSNSHLQQSQICIFCATALSKILQKKTVLDTHHLNSYTNKMETQTKSIQCRNNQNIAQSKNCNSYLNEGQKQNIYKLKKFPENLQIAEKVNEQNKLQKSKPLRAQRKVKLGIKNERKKETSLAIETQIMQNYLQNSIAGYWKDIKRFNQDFE